MEFTCEKDLIIVIPAYEPDGQLINLLLRLSISFINFKIIIIDDGSKNSQDIFKRCSDFKNVTILTHECNKGKGQALKTAFCYIKENFSNPIIITVDSDGQHKCEDIKKVYNFYLANQGSLVLGSRKFEGDVPKKSTIGNDVSRALIRLCHNTHLNDTQTGLRAFGKELLDFMINIPGSRYEYEMNMISEAIRSEITIYEIPIQTVYINQNRASHFRPIKDFTKICLTILKYAIPLLISVAANIIAFIALSKTTSFAPFVNIMIAYPASLIIYLLINLSGIVFGRKNLLRQKKTLLREIIYYFASQMISIIITLETFLATGHLYFSYIISIVADILLISLANYFILKKSEFQEVI